MHEDVEEGWIEDYLPNNIFLSFKDKPFKSLVHELDVVWKYIDAVKKGYKLTPKDLEYLTEFLRQWELAQSYVR